MRRTLILSLVAGSAPVLAGCVAAVAANVVGRAVGSARKTPVGNEQAKPAAVRDCSARAAPYGKVRIIDVEQRTPSKIVVWGSVDDGKRRQSFECGYGTTISSFRLRATKVGF